MVRIYNSHWCEPAFRLYNEHSYKFSSISAQTEVKIIRNLRMRIISAIMFFMVACYFPLKSVQ